MRKPTIRRLIAYLIDIVIVALIASALASVKYFNPYIKQYRVVEEKYQTLVDEVSKDTTKLNELLNGEEMKTLSYEMSKSGVFVSIYTVALSFLYFVCFQYYTKGKTLGKLITRIEVVSNDKDNLKFVQLLKRSLIINSLVTSTLLAILILVLNKAHYLNYSRYVQMIDSTLIILSIGFVLYREDGRGLHDLFGGTRVIMTADKEFYLKHDGIKEAEIVEEVEEEKKVVKKRTTTKKGK